YTSADMAADFKHLHAALGLGPAMMVGHSFGGVVSMHTAVLHPEIVRGVILSDSFFPGLRHVEPNFGKMTIWADLREKFATVGVELGDTVDFANLFRSTAALPPDRMKKLEEIFGAFGRGWLRQLPLLAETSCGDDVLREAGLTADAILSVARPVVALYDEHSPFLATSAWLERNLPRCIAEIIPGAKHLAVVENTAAFTDAVRRHLRRLSGERRSTLYFLSFILKNLTRRPIRSSLTILGLGVAVGSMVALLGVSHNVTKSVTDSFTRRGVDLIVTEAGKSSDLNSDIGEELIDRAEQLPGVKATARGLVDMLDMTRPSGSVDAVMIQGRRADNFAFDDMEMLAGRKLTAEDHGKVLLGIKLADNIRKTVGDKLTIRGTEFEVIGVYKSFVVFENGSATMLLKDAQALTGKRTSGFSVRVEKSNPFSTTEVEAVRQAIQDLRDPKDPTVRLAVRTPDEYQESQTYLKMLRAVAWMVSVIGLLVGVISMVNTMVMSVVERTQEIGILRAVGWPRWRVIRMILGEAVVLGVAAAVVGSIGAVAATHLLAMSPKVSGFIEGGIAPVVLAQGAGLTLLIGVVGGLYPALRAAQLQPTEAIRHD
ncbi:MAG TPA: alpha/beta fold hydrolase, partial [Gemmataceae bacterium]|nr:alpha/beta fold hydrolase [Gemmataceae bacterium]